MIDIVRGALPIHFFTIVVKVTAVDRAFPNARDGFMAAFGATSYNGGLFGLSVMAADSIDRLLTRLEQEGIIPGVDVAVACMSEGPLLECPGMVFRSEGEFHDTRWLVEVDEHAALPEPPVQECLAMPVQRVSPTPHSTPGPNGHEAPRQSSAAWRRYTDGRGGLVFWPGCGEEDVEYAEEAPAILLGPLAIKPPTPARTSNLPKTVVTLEGLTAGDYYDILDAGLTDILAHTGADVDERLFEMLLIYNRCLRIALGLPVPVTN